MGSRAPFSDLAPAQVSDLVTPMVVRTAPARQKMSIQKLGRYILNFYFYLCLSGSTFIFMFTIFWRAGAVLTTKGVARGQHIGP
jgi:hypothetical protein